MNRINTRLSTIITLAFSLLIINIKGYADMPSTQYQQVLDFWLGPMVKGYPVEDRNKLWFMGSTQDDREIVELFGDLTDQALHNQLTEWEADSKSRLALIIILDQFTRSIYRKSAQAFAGDRRAQKLTNDFINKGLDVQLEFSERQFLYMPLMHSENLVDQELCINMFNKLAQAVPENKKAQAQSSIRYAVEHRDLIAKFGRFPYRNRALNRKSTLEELEYLSNGANSYGQ